MKTLTSLTSYALTLCCIFFLGITEPPQDLNAKDIVKKADDNIRDNTSQANITIKIISPPTIR